MQEIHSSPRRSFWEPKLSVIGSQNLGMACEDGIDTFDGHLLRSKALGDKTHT